MSHEQSFDAALLDALTVAGRLDQAAAERARRVQDGTGERLHRILTRLALVSEREMAAALAAQMGQELLAAGDYPLAPMHDRPLSPRFLKEVRVVPLAASAEGLVIAMADPLDEYAIGAIALATGTPVTVRVGVPADIEAAIERAYSSREPTGPVIETVGEEDGDGEDLARLRDLATEAPVIKLVNALIARAVEARASDIHIEPLENRLRVRYRIDGVMQEVEAPPARLRAAVVSRIKILAKLNIAERRLPQDGRIRLAVRGKEIDLRISTVPGMHGESVVMRILDRGSVALDLPVLGFAGQTLERLLNVVDRPNGIVLVTGPTGSGKTTSLYAALKRLNTVDRKIHTVEDPIEYQLDGITQVQVKPQIGLTFANILRSILRQDPDVILIGEIRDLETAQIATQASLTGHLVLSTLHTNSAAASITRLLDMGVEDYLLSATVNGIVAQRLVRTLCPHCREPYAPLRELTDRLGIARGAPLPQLYRPRGCALCHGLGFLGRTTIAEVLPMTEAVRRLVLDRADVSDIQRLAQAEGMATMFEDGMTKVLAGLTTPEEVLRVTRDATEPKQSAALTEG